MEHSVKEPLSSLMDLDHTSGILREGEREGGKEEGRKGDTSGLVSPSTELHP